MHTPLSRRLLRVASLCVGVGLPAAALASAPPIGGASTGSAEQIYTEAQRHYLAKRYTEALPLFERLVRQQHSPNARLYLARCLRELGRLARAHDEMALTAREAAARATTEPRFESTSRTATQEVAALRQRVTMLTIALAGQPADLVVELGGEAIDTATLTQPVTIMPGTVVLRAEAPGFAPFRRELELTPGSSSTVAIALTPLAAPPPAPSPGASSTATPPTTATPTPGAAALGPAAPPISSARAVPPPPTGGGRSPILLASGLTLTALGVVGGAGFGVLRALAAARYESISNACGGGPCPDSSHDSDIDTGEAIDVAAHISLGAGAASLVTGAILLGVYLADDGSGAPPPPDRARLELRTDGRGAVLLWTVALPL